MIGGPPPILFGELALFRAAESVVGLSCCPPAGAGEQSQLSSKAHWHARDGKSYSKMQSPDQGVSKVVQPHSGGLDRPGEISLSRTLWGRSSLPLVYSSRQCP